MNKCDLDIWMTAAVMCRQQLSLYHKQFEVGPSLWKRNCMCVLNDGNFYFNQDEVLRAGDELMARGLLRSAGLSGFYFICSNGSNSSTSNATGN
jgi:hypothetical protein